MAEQRTLHDLSDQEILDALETDRRGEPVSPEIRAAIDAGLASGDLSIETKDEQAPSEPGLGKRVVDAAVGAVIDEVANTVKDWLKR